MTGRRRIISLRALFLYPQRHNSPIVELKEGGRDDHMTCMEFNGKVLSYVECTLSPKQLAAVYTHAAGCPECGNYLQNYRRVVILLKEERRIARTRIGSLVERLAVR